MRRVDVTQKIRRGAVEYEVLVVGWVNPRGAVAWVQAFGAGMEIDLSPWEEEAAISTIEANLVQEAQRGS